MSVCNWVVEATAHAGDLILESTNLVQLIVRSRPVAVIQFTRHHRAMNATDYFLPPAADETDLFPWSSILPSPVRILRTNLFGDPFVVDAAGAVYMLDRGGCSTERIAASEQDFWHAIQDDCEGWQLRRLADGCRRAGKLLADGQCYAFTTPPVLGGEYAVENVWVAPWREWLAFTADLFRQIEGVPDGATVSLKVVDWRTAAPHQITTFVSGWPE